VILNAEGGERLDDYAHLRRDAGLTEFDGYELPSPEAARKFLNAFHEEERAFQRKILPIWPVMPIGRPRMYYLLWVTHRETDPLRKLANRLQ
jgi:hypothetical protein